MAQTIRPPGPAGNILFGSMLELMRRPTLEFMTELAETYGDIASYRVGQKTSHLLNHPEFIHAILVKHADKVQKTASARRVAGRLLGNGLILSEGTFWQRQRRLMQPHLHTTRIETYLQIMHDDSKALITTWSAGQRVDMQAAMMRLTLAIVVRALFNADVNDPNNAIPAAIETVLETTRKGFKVPVPDWVPIPSNRAKIKAIEVLDSILMNIIEERRRTNERGKDLLSLLLHAVDEDDGSQMTNRQLRDEAMTIFMAGHETSANALTWVWYLLSQHPDVEAQVIAEIDAHWDENNLTIQSLRQLEITERVIKEALRMYPPIWIVSRALMEDIQLGDYLLRAGESVVISPYIIQHNPQVFVEPETFSPERFLPENEKAIPRGGYIPFGAGPRICIGQSFSLMEMKVVLATIFKEYRFQLPPDHIVELKATTTLRPRGGLPMIILARQA